MGKFNMWVAPLALLLASLLLPSSLACYGCPSVPTPSPPPPKPKPCPPPPPPPSPKPCPPPPPPPAPKYTPTPCPPPPGKTTPNPPAKTTGCPIDTLKLDGCVDVLGGLVHAVIGRKATDVCCPVLSGLVDLDAAACLCTTIRAKVLNINIVLPVALQVLIDCGKRVPADYQCPVY